MTNLKFFWSALLLVSVFVFACKTRSNGIQNETPTQQESHIPTVSLPTEISAETDSFQTNWALPSTPQTLQFRATDNGNGIPTATYQLTVTD
jgi:hypothetical protein